MRLKQGIFLTIILLVSSTSILYWSSDPLRNPLRAEYTIVDYALKDEMYSAPYTTELRETSSYSTVKLVFDENNEAFGIFYDRENWKVFTKKRKIWWSKSERRVFWKPWDQSDENYQSVLRRFENENSDFY